MWNSISVDKELAELSELENKEILTLILLELKKITLHLYSITDEEGV